MEKKRVGLYFGTFNPIHVGHLVIANYMADYTDLDEVWLVVTPQNPLKKKTSLLADYHRLALVRTAIEDNPKLKASDIEFGLPKPSYTVNTLVHLKEKHTDHQFSLIMGEDNLRTLHKWKNHEIILTDHELFVYPRALTVQEEAEVKAITDAKNEFAKHQNVHLCEAPVMKVSSSFIRKAIKENKDVRYLLTEPVYKYVKDNRFYEQ
jgi:nicotinate-nucleotide adenylyltransferase